MILLIDNYDSFVHNLARHFRRLGQETVVVRNDSVTIADIRSLLPQAIVISPGPCTPSEAGVSLAVVENFADTIPLLGVCLGHQAIAAALGGRVVRADEPVHGRTSQINHASEKLFADLPSPMDVCRYHSLVVERKSLPQELVVTAETHDGIVMAFEHRNWSVYGVQFHPEAVLTQHGYQLLANFLSLAGIDFSADIKSLASSENRTPKPLVPNLPTKPVPH